MPLTTEPIGGSSKLGKLCITADLLRDLLRLPEGTKFRRFQSAEFSGPAGTDLECIIECDEMPEVYRGRQIPNINAMYRSERIDNADVLITTFDKWSHQ